MTIWTDIRNVLNKTAAGVSGFPPPGQQDLDGFTYQPTLDKIWARLHLIPVSEQPCTVDAKIIERRGLFQVDIFTPSNTGLDLAESIAENVKAAFRPGQVKLSLPNSNDMLFITWAQRIHAFKDNDQWEPISVMVNWRCFSPKQ